MCTEGCGCVRRLLSVILRHDLALLARLVPFLARRFCEIAYVRDQPLDDEVTHENDQQHRRREYVFCLQSIPVRAGGVLREEICAGAGGTYRDAIDERVVLRLVDACQRPHSCRLLDHDGQGEQHLRRVVELVAIHRRLLVEVEDGPFVRKVFVPAEAQPPDDSARVAATDEGKSRAAYVKPKNANQVRMGIPVA